MATALTHAAPSAQNMPPWAAFSHPRVFAYVIFSESSLFFSITFQGLLTSAAQKSLGKVKNTEIWVPYQTLKLDFWEWGPGSCRF